MLNQPVHSVINGGKRWCWKKSFQLRRFSLVFPRGYNEGSTCGWLSAHQILTPYLLWFQKFNPFNFYFRKFVSPILASVLPPATPFWFHLITVPKGYLLKTWLSNPNGLGACRGERSHWLTITASEIGRKSTFLKRDFRFDGSQRLFYSSEHRSYQ